MWVVAAIERERAIERGETVRESGYVLSREFIVGVSERAGRVSRRERERESGTEQQHERERESNNSWVRACTGRVFLSVCVCV